MVIQFGNKTQLLNYLKYRGDSTPVDKGKSAILPLGSFELQGQGKIDEENPTVLKANQSAELKLELPLRPTQGQISVEVNPILHEAGLVRASAIIGPGDEWKCFFTAQRKVDLSELEYFVHVRLINNY